MKTTSIAMLGVVALVFGGLLTGGLVHAQTRFLPPGTSGRWQTPRPYVSNQYPNGTRRPQVGRGMPVPPQIRVPQQPNKTRVIRVYPSRQQGYRGLPGRHTGPFARYPNIPKRLPEQFVPVVPPITEPPVIYQPGSPPGSYTIHRYTVPSRRPQIYYRR